MMKSPLIASLRPRQWTKNLLVFAGLLFSQHLTDAGYVLRSSAAFLVFSLLSGVLYIVNDLADLRSDRVHPVKKHRPIASGRLRPAAAVVFCAIAGPALLVAAFRLAVPFGWITLAYAFLVMTYSLGLKHVVVLDVMLIAVGFVLRAVAGALVIHVAISSWLLVCTIFLALFLALNKRRHERILLGNHAVAHRRILADYSVGLLDQLIAMVSACTLMAYALYTTAPETQAKFGTRDLVLTLPFVIYGLFRYLYLVHHKGLGGSPEEVLLTDRPMLFNIGLYLLTTGAIIYYFRYE